MHCASNRRLVDLVQQFSDERLGLDNTVPHWIGILAVMFAALGMLFALNIGISLIAIAVAIVYYSRFGERIAAPLGAMLLCMLAIWMMVMPAHHLAASSLCIFLAALGPEIYSRLRFGHAKPLGRTWRYFLDGPVYGLVMLMKKLALKEKLAETNGYDQN